MALETGCQEAAGQLFSSLEVRISGAVHPTGQGAAQFYLHLIPFKGQGQAVTERQASTVSHQP